MANEMEQRARADDGRIAAVLAVWGRCVEYLPACLENVADQEGVSQVVIVDNACEPPIEIISAPDTTIVRFAYRVTLGEALNAGLTVADRELVAFVDVDDTILPGTFAFLSDRLTARPELVSVAAGLMAWDPVSGASRPYGWPSRLALRLAGMPKVFSMANAFRPQYPMATCALHRLDAVRSAGGFPRLDYCCDWALANRLLRQGPVELHERPGRLYRIDPASLSHCPSWREIMRSHGEVRRHTAAGMTPAALSAALKLSWAPAHLALGAKEWRRLRKVRADAGQSRRPTPPELPSPLAQQPAPSHGEGQRGR